ncbi:MAG TPA: hypothetical protein VGA36_10395 [Nitriliruptorales bacterium]
MSSLGLYDLLTPYFLAGAVFDERHDAFLSKLGVVDLSSAYDQSAVIHTGTLQFGAGAPLRLTSSRGTAGFAWEDARVRFRLTVPRDGAALIDTAIGAAPLPQLAPLKGLLDQFLPVEQGTAPTEYPGIRFRLELLLDEVYFDLGSDWLPGKLDSGHRIVKDASITDPVRLVLPKPVFVYEMGDDSLSTPPTFALSSWGGGGFDAPSTLAAGELVRMEPPIAVYKDGKVGFGLGSVVLDLDPDHTPPEILRFFGTDESFTGLYVQSARVYVSDVHKGYGFHLGVQDLLISFDGEVSFEVSADVLGPEVTLSAKLVVSDQGRPVEVDAGDRTGASTTTATVVEGGSFTASSAALVQVEVTGGQPPHTVAVTPDAGGTPRFDAATGRVKVDDLAVGDRTLTLQVTDSSGQSYTETVTMHVTAAPPAPTAATAAGSAADRPRQQGDLPTITHTGGSGTSHSIVPAGTATGTRERFRLTGPGTPTVTANGTPVTATDGVAEVDVPEGTTNLAIVATWPALSSAPASFALLFIKDWPKESDSPAILARYAADFTPSTATPTVVGSLDDKRDDLYLNSRMAGQDLGGTAALRAWLDDLKTANGGTTPTVSITASASFELVGRLNEDDALSGRRRDIGVAAVGTHGTLGSPPTATGFAAAQAAQRTNDPSDRKAVVTAVVTQPAETVTLTVSRGTRPAPTADPPPQRQPERPPAPLPSQPPGVFRRAGVRVKVIRNDPVLLEISARLDFETDLEAKMRNPDGAPAINGNLQLHQQPGATADAASNPQDGVVDVRLTIVHDPATHSWTETLALGAHPDDVNGLLQMRNLHSGSPTADTRLNDALGSVMILAPIIGVAVGATDPNSAGSYAVLGGTIVGAAAIGAAGFLQTEKITLYGGELRFRQFIPPGDPMSFSDAGVLFDYAVEFGVDVPSLGIETTRPLKVRYRAIGFNINFQGGGYQPIFDTSKGYELDLSDPGLFALPAPIDNVLKIFAARIAKVNPLTVELDLGMKVDLGVVRIDKFKVKIPVDPFGVPTILPSGISVDISQVLVGSGFVNIVEPPAAPAGQEQPGFGGIEGAFDVSLVPIKLRIAASFGVRPISDAASGRKATAVFLGLIVDLPAPIPLAQSGIGIYGFSGLFAMHYKRLENDPDPTDATGPAILWLKAAGGEPAKLFNNGVTLWGPELDRWSFGVGIMLGTTEGGFLINLRGMFVLELPGPRILVFVKILIVQVMPDLKPGNDLTAGILGVIDLDIGRRSFTLGIIVDLEIEEIVSLTVPVELFTKLDDLKNWHLYIGTFGAPASATVLDIVRGFGYVMIAGHEITGWPGYGQLRNLPGIAMAAGIGASVVFGDESIGLYLKVSARADVAVSFSPRLFLVGRIQLDGELRLFIVSVGAHGRLDVEAPDPTHIRGEICGHVDFFFFSVEGCVSVEIGPSPPDPPPPSIVRNVWLQSHAPVITAGQGGDRPIDASLGDAVPSSGSATLPVVPIDSVPVVQFLTAPTVSSALTTFTRPLAAAPTLPPGGWVQLGGNRQVTYELTAITLSGGSPLFTAGVGAPKATWRPDPASSSASGTAAVDLALFSNVPLMGARALERSTDLTVIVDGVFGGVCRPTAPPAAVLWTFCRQPLGPSGVGWELHGDAWPDPPGTARSTPVDVDLRVDEPSPDPLGAQLDAVLGHTSAGGSQPAKVIGPAGPIDGVEQPEDPTEPEDPTPPREICVDLVRVLKDGAANPAMLGKPLRATVLDFNAVPYPSLRIGGVGSHRGLDVGFRTELSLARPCTRVTLTVVTFAGGVRAAGLDRSGRLVARATASGQQGVPETLRLAGRGITRVVLDAPSDETLLLRVCVVPDLRPLPGIVLEPVRPLVVRELGIRDVRAGSALATTKGKVDCMRALALPERTEPQGKGSLELTQELQDLADKRPDERWVDLVTGPATYAVLYLVVDRRLLAADGVVVEQIAGDLSVLASDPLNALSPVTVVPPTGGLPATWLDPSGPWWDEVEPVTTFLGQPQFASHVHLTVTVKPDPRSQRLRVRVVPGSRAHTHPVVVLGVAEVMRLGEEERFLTEEEIRTGQVDTLFGYLDGTSKVPLLTPASTYTLSLTYAPRAEDTKPDGTVASSTFPAVTEAFRFRTDSAPPKRLDAYVLATDPAQEEEFVFADDPVTVVFNDLQIVQLYETYGRTLTAVLRGADGIAIPTHEVGDLDEVPATFTSPLYEAIRDLVENGGARCVPHHYHVEGHGSFTLPVPLRPSMAYTLDIEAQPVPTPPAGKPIVPLFRRHFRTGRFTSLEALVGELKARPLLHRVLTGPVTGLTLGAVATDLQIETALTAAGLAPLGAPDRGSRVVLWRPHPSGRHVPHAILLDADEPLWRFRDAPRQEVVPGQPDAAYQRIVPGRESSLHLTATGPVAGFVRSASGTRTLVMLNDAAWPTAGATVTVDAVRPPSTLYGFAGQTARVTTVPLEGQAPWDEED